MHVSPEYKVIQLTVAHAQVVAKTKKASTTCEQIIVLTDIIMFTV